MDHSNLGHSHHPRGSPMTAETLLPPLKSCPFCGQKPQPWGTTWFRCSTPECIARGCVAEPAAWNHRAAAPTGIGGGTGKAVREALEDAEKRVDLLSYTLEENRPVPCGAPWAAAIQQLRMFKAHLVALRALDATPSTAPAADGEGE